MFCRSLRRRLPNWLVVTTTGFDGPRPLDSQGAHDPTPEQKTKEIIARIVTAAIITRWCFLKILNGLAISGKFLVDSG